ncbi:MAG: hypothetical protein ACOX2O_00095 [Bdellovibrionota bacterium]|jgi:hypothetical protein
MLLSDLLEKEMTLEEELLLAATLFMDLNPDLLKKEDSATSLEWSLNQLKDMPKSWKRELSIAVLISDMREREEGR